MDSLGSLGKEIHYDNFEIRSFIRIRFCNKACLDLLGEDSVVYKLLGPVLVKQDKEEAVSTVKNRADYMENELKRYQS